ncbi:PepSY domain-containing protein [Phenylobacterium sp.]|uniref:PepSY-associated TM helix domain-containing protein n=1 Tax=Phenylobacterium sp. TaxID=1871053 RepID=UPI0025CD1CE5|nr:PepSY-associated TM helix domain-containing protein [Phenylobacterium sp.]
MQVIDLLHRWLGGLVGLLLAVLGLSGAILLHKGAWVMLPHAHEAQVQDTATLAAVANRIMAQPDHPRSIVFATKDFGLNQLSYAERGTGAYTSQAGELVTKWSSKWERPEVWLFDLHHHLFSGETGDTVAGVAGLIGVGFVVTGAILWWRMRRAYEFRLWPRKFERFQILRHHRDLGIVMAPLLALSMVTGAVMVFRPVADVVLGPGTSAAVTQALKPPPPSTAKLADDLDYGAMIETARRLYPTAEVRILSSPRGKSGLVSLRLRQPAEWLPNGRTTLYFAADTGELVQAKDALTLPAQVQAYNALYPLHAGKIGGLPYRLAMTLSGVTLTLLGSLTVWTFWFRRKPKRRRRDPLPVT